MEPLIADIIGPESQYIRIKDVTAVGTNWLDMMTSPFSQTLLALVNGGNAHASYWHSLRVADEMASTLLRAAETPDISR